MKTRVLKEKNTEKKLTTTGAELQSVKYDKSWLESLKLLAICAGIFCGHVYP